MSESLTKKGNIKTSFLGEKDADINFTRIGKASFVIAIFTALGGLVGIVREAVIAQYFGVTDSTDAYFIAINIILALVGLISGTATAVIIPAYIDAKIKLDVQKGEELFDTFLMIMTLLCVLAALLVASLAPYYIPLLVSGFNEEKTSLTIFLLWWTAPLIFLNGVISLWNGYLNSHYKFAVVAFLPVVVSITVIIWVYMGQPQLGVTSIAIGLVTGTLVQGILLYSYIFSRFRNPIKVCINFKDPLVFNSIAQFGFLISGAVFSRINVLIDQAMASWLSPGSVSALGFGGRVINWISEIIGFAVATAFLPVLSAQISKNNYSTIQALLMKALKLSVQTLIPLTILLYFSSTLMTTLIYERGAFDAEATRIVAGVIRFYSFQLFFLTVGMIGVRVLNAAQRNDLIMKIAFASVFVHIIGNVILMKWLGVAGIALSTSLTYVFTSTAIYYYLYRLGFLRFK